MSKHADTFVELDGLCLFAERPLYLDWVDERPLS
jgi:hypothetical protein